MQIWNCSKGEDVNRLPFQNQMTDGHCITIVALIYRHLGLSLCCVDTKRSQTVIFVSYFWGIRLLNLSLSLSTVDMNIVDLTFQQCRFPWLLDFHCFCSLASFIFFLKDHYCDQNRSVLAAENTRRFENSYLPISIELMSDALKTLGASDEKCQYTTLVKWSSEQ